MWVLFRAPTPTPDGRTARDLYERRIDWITPEMRKSASEHGCSFHRAWHAQDGSAFYALACWERLSRISREHADATLVFYCRADCWMSWNAAKRALAWGFATSGWFRCRLADLDRETRLGGRAGELERALSVEADCPRHHGLEIARLHDLLDVAHAGRLEPFPSVGELQLIS